MTRIINCLSVFAVLCLLTGCSEIRRGLDDLATGFEHFGEDVGRVIEGEDITQESSAANDTADFSKYRTSVDAPTGWSGTSYQDSAYQKTDRSVEVYPLDGVYTPATEVSPLPEANSAATYYSRDPSITIYPLDFAYRPQPYPGGQNTVKPGVVHSILNHVDRRPSVVFGSEEDIAAAVGLEDFLPEGTVVIAFPHDQTTLTAEARRKIKDIAEEYKAHGTVSNIAIHGHASKRAVGTKEQRRKTNLRVSMSRAHSVAKALIAAGVPADVIETKAYGDTQPKATEAQSRRVEVFKKK